MNDEKDLTIKEAFDLAVKNHQNNNLQDAQNYYQQVLKIDPNHSQSLSNIAFFFRIFFILKSISAPLTV